MVTGIGATSIDVVSAAIERVVLKYSLKKWGYVDVCARELIAYFDGTAPSGDITTVSEVIGKDWLLVHELIEISEMKKLGLTISIGLLYDHAEVVELAHLRASEVELDLARQHGDRQWVETRLADIRAWQKDDGYSFELKEKCQYLIDRYV